MGGAFISVSRDAPLPLPFHLLHLMMKVQALIEFMNRGTRYGHLQASH